LANRLLALGLAHEAVRILEEVEPHCETARDQERVLGGIARGGQMLRDWPRIIGAGARRRALRSDSGDGGEQEHGAFELLELEASLYSASNWDLVKSRIREFATSNGAAPEHRIEAAVIGLVLADNSGCASFGSELIAATQAIVPRSRRAAVGVVTSRMVFETGFGSMSQAEEAANDLVGLAESIVHPVARAVALRRACYTFRRNCNFERARDVLGEALGIAKRMRLPSQALPALELMTHVALDTGDFDSARRSLNGARRASSETPGDYATAAVAVAEARLAFESLDPASLAASTRAVFNGGASLPLARSAQLLAASRGSVLIGAGAVSELAEPLQELVAHYATLRALGLQDYPVSVLVQALAMLGRSDDAAAYLRDYLAVRREPGVLAPSLLRLVAAFGSTPRTSGLPL
jgi:hypothetical protein